MCPIKAFTELNGGTCSPKILRSAIPSDASLPVSYTHLDVYKRQTEIVSNAKDKGGQDDVDDVELNSQNSHQSQDDYLSLIHI